MEKLLLFKFLYLFHIFFATVLVQQTICDKSGLLLIFLDVGELLVDFIFEDFFIFSGEEVAQSRCSACVDVLTIKKLTYCEWTDLDVSLFHF